MPLCRSSAEFYAASLRYCRGLTELIYPFRDRDMPSPAVAFVWAFGQVSGQGSDTAFNARPVELMSG